jgi:tetratricopeptide (TPR) repeat protein
VTEAVTRAQFLVEAGRHADARAALVRHLSTTPDDFDALCLLTQCHLGLGSHEAALESAARAIQLHANQEWPHRLAALAFAAQGAIRQAREQADIAISLAPTEWRTYVARAQIDLPGHVYGRTGECAREAVRLAPLEAAAHRTLGSVLVAEGALEMAERHLHEALRLDPHDAASRNELARLDLRRRNLGSAAAGFADVARLAPDDTAGAHNLQIVGARVVRVALLTMWLVMFTLGRLAINATHAQRLLLGVGWSIAAVVIGGFAVRLHRDSHGRIWRLLRIVAHRDRLLATMALLLAVAFGALGLAAVLPRTGLHIAYGLAAASVLGAVILSWRRRGAVRGRRRRGASR